MSQKLKMQKCGRCSNIMFLVPTSLHFFQNYLTFALVEQREVLGRDL